MLLHARHGRLGLPLEAVQLMLDLAAHLPGLALGVALGRDPAAPLTLDFDST